MSAARRPFRNGPSGPLRSNADFAVVPAANSMSAVRACWTGRNTRPTSSRSLGSGGCATNAACEIGRKCSCSAASCSAMRSSATVKPSSRRNWLMSCAVASAARLGRVACSGEDRRPNRDLEKPRASCSRSSSPVRGRSYPGFGMTSHERPKARTQRSSKAPLWLTQQLVARIAKQTVKSFQAMPEMGLVFGGRQNLRRDHGC